MPLYEVAILGFRLNAVERPEFALMRVFRIDEATARKVMQRFPVVVKRGITLEQARSYERALLSIGARVSVRDQGETPPVARAGVPASHPQPPILPPAAPESAPPPPEPLLEFVPPSTTPPSAQPSAAKSIEADEARRTSGSPLREQLFELDESAAIPDIDTSALRHTSRPPRDSARALEHALQHPSERPPVSLPPAAAPASHAPRGPSARPAASSRPAAAHSSWPAPAVAQPSVDRPPVSAATQAGAPLARTTRYGEDLELPWVTPRHSLAPRG